MSIFIGQCGIFVFYFFFQAEDGIRDRNVTGVQTCALPIFALNHVSFLDAALAVSLLEREPVFAIDHGIAQRWWVKRSEERRVGKEGRAGGWAEHEKKGQEGGES